MSKFSKLLTVRVLKYVPSKTRDEAVADIVVVVEFLSYVAASKLLFFVHTAN